MKNQSLTAKWEARISLYWVAPLILLMTVAIFWRPHFFFIADDWTALFSMTSRPFWSYVTDRDAEQWFPVFHLVYYLMVKFAGENYKILVLVNCVVSGINSILVYLLFRRHLRPIMALVLGLVYAGLSVHTTTIWMAYNICYLLALGFFFTALLVTDSYMRRPSWPKLAGIGLLCLLAIHSHSVVILGVGTIPLYYLLLREPDRPARFLPLAVTMALVFLLFSMGYLQFVGLESAKSQNTAIFSWPGLSYLRFWFYAAFISPMVYLSFVLHFKYWSYYGAIALWSVSLAAIFLLGDSRDKRFSLWALSLNALPLALVSLARYHFPMIYATTSRYAVITSIGALLIMGTAWRVLARRLPSRTWIQVLPPMCVVTLIVVLQFLQLSIADPKHRDISRKAQTCYRQLEAGPQPGQAGYEEWAKEPFCPGARTFINRGQVRVIRDFLKGAPYE